MTFMRSEFLIILLFKVLQQCFECDELLSTAGSIREYTWGKNYSGNAFIGYKAFKALGLTNCPLDQSFIKNNGMK